MTLAALAFWLSVMLVGYTYAGFPLLATWLARWRGTSPQESSQFPPLTVVVAAYNEEARIAARVRDILAQDYPPERLQVLVVSDGSTDATAQRAQIGDARVRVLELESNQGKACALNAAMERIGTGLVAFTDVRQRYGASALRRLVAPFTDPSVGAVSGELVIGSDNRNASAEGVGLYWRMEKALRFAEARLGWLHGVSGAVYAMRRDLFRPLPAGTVLDDMWTPLQVILQQRRVWMARDALAYDQPSGRSREEFDRKLRTLAGNWQLIARLPVLLHPLRNPVFLAWVSHKLLRLLAPWALLVAVVSAAMAEGDFYRWALWLQLLAYGWAVLGLVLPRLAARIPLLPAAGAFVMLNLAALFSLPASLAWDPARLWKKH